MAYGRQTLRPMPSHGGRDARKEVRDAGAWQGVSVAREWATVIEIGGYTLGFIELVCVGASGWAVAGWLLVDGEMHHPRHQRSSIGRHGP